MTQTNGQTQERERILAPSRSGRGWCVAELHWQPAESDLEAEGFEVSGYFSSKSRAGMRRAQLQRAGLWLSPESRAAMSSGRVLRVRDLQWATS